MRASATSAPALLGTWEPKINTVNAGGFFAGILRKNLTGSKRGIALCIWLCCREAVIISSKTAYDLYSRPIRHAIQ
jgi:hypothetical protein